MTNDEIKCKICGNLHEKNEKILFKIKMKNGKRYKGYGCPRCKMSQIKEYLITLPKLSLIDRLLLDFFSERFPL